MYVGCQSRNGFRCTIVLLCLLLCVHHFFGLSSFVGRLSVAFCMLCSLSSLCNAIHLNLSNLFVHFVHGWCPIGVFLMQLLMTPPQKTLIYQMTQNNFVGKYLTLPLCLWMFKKLWDLILQTRTFRISWWCFDVFWIRNQGSYFNFPGARQSVQVSYLSLPLAYWRCFWERHCVGSGKNTVLRKQSFSNFMIPLSYLML